jgi:hypothetical protein
MGEKNAALQRAAALAFPAHVQDNLRGIERLLFAVGTSGKPVMLTMIAECFGVSVSAWVFFGVLTAPGMIFEAWYSMLERMAANGRGWLAKPLGMCGACFSGQMGFWWYLVAYRDAWILGQHIVFTSYVIFFFLTIKSFWAKYVG